MDMLYKLFEVISRQDEDAPVTLLLVGCDSLALAVIVWLVWSHPVVDPVVGWLGGR